MAIFFCLLLFFVTSEAQIKYNSNDPLILTPYLNANLIEQAQNLSQVQLADFLNVKSYSGYFTVDEATDSNLFFWFFPSENDYSTDPVILYIHGGPGLSTMYALFQENGPFVVINETVTLRDVRLTKNHSVIFVDNPVGTGFSFTNNGYARNDSEVGNHLYTAMVQFFTMFPDLKTNDFWLAGESHAGKFIPALGYVIHQRNAKSNVSINLKGLIVCSPYIQPIDQIDFGEYAYRVDLIDAAARDQLNEILKEAKEAMEKANFAEVSIKMNLLSQSVSNITGIKSFYNYLLVQENQNTHYQIVGDQDWINFLNKNKTKQAIHVGTKIFYQSFQPTIGEMMLSDIHNSVAPWLSELLNHYRVLFFSGQLDLLVPYHSVMLVLKNLKFSGAEEYKTAKRAQWLVGNDVAGYCKKAGLLEECLVRDAGHVVPFEQPEYAFDLIYKFVRNISLTEN